MAVTHLHFLPEIQEEGNFDTFMIKPRALMVASVASMHDLFNMDNIYIFLELGYDVDVAANFESGSTTSQERVEEYRQELVNRGIGVYHIPIPRKLDKIEEICISYDTGIG